VNPSHQAQEQVETSSVMPVGQVSSTKSAISLRENTLSDLEIPSPNATIGTFGPPYRPASTPGSCSFTTATSSGLRGYLVQYGVEGVMPSMLSALRGCWRYAIAAAVSASPFVIPADLAKSIIWSATSCWSQTPPVDRSALMPARPASSTHGWFVSISPSLSSYYTANQNVG
jgi:hypothetical protein